MSIREPLKARLQWPARMTKSASPSGSASARRSLPDRHPEQHLPGPQPGGPRDNGRAVETGTGAGRRIDPHSALRSSSHHFTQRSFVPVGQNAGIPPPVIRRTAECSFRMWCGAHRAEGNRRTTRAVVSGRRDSRPHGAVPRTPIAGMAAWRFQRIVSSASGLRRSGRGP